MLDLRISVQQLPRCGLRCGDQPPHPPFAAVPAAKADIGQIGDSSDKGIMGFLRHVPVHMHHHRTAGIRPMPDHLFGAVKGGVHQHDNTQRHAQFPLDISPRPSSWRQLM